MSQWTKSRRERQATVIHQWKPWMFSTGPRTASGKARVARNAYKGGKREEARLFARQISLYLRMQREAMNKVPSA